jgi:tetratricopeptide (TPR) repeat protein
VLWQSSAPRPAARQTQDTAPVPRRAESTPHHTETLATAAERPPESTPRPRDVGVRSVVLHSSRDGLQRANAARARKEFARAERLYLRVANLHPGSDDAAAADLAAAELRYQHLGRPRDALPLYNKLLQAHAQGPLAEQARAGIARAYAVLGDKTAERIAWQTLLRQHPKSWFVVEARTRLDALQSSSSRPAENREVK